MGLSTSTSCLCPQIPYIFLGIQPEAGCIRADGDFVNLASEGWVVSESKYNPPIHLPAPVDGRTSCRTSTGQGVRGRCQWHPQRRVLPVRLPCPGLDTSMSLVCP